MTDNTAFFDQLPQRSASIVADLKADERIGEYIDASLPVPKPFVGSGPIRLVIIGQDPTIQNLEARQRVTTVLTLDQKGGNLYRFVGRICAGLGLSLEEHVYATNVCKNFFTAVPKRVGERDLIALSWPKWETLLLGELALFPDAIVVTLGEPVIGVLVRQSRVQCLRHYWGHRQKWTTKGIGNFRLVDEAASSFRRRFFPLPHITNANTTKLYRTHFDRYLSFIRLTTAGKGVA